MKTKDLLRVICGCRIRFCRLIDGQWRIWPQDEDEARQVVAALCESGKVKRGNSGWVSLPSLGLVQFCYRMTLSREDVLVLLPAIRPNAQFSGTLPIELGL